MLQLECVIVTNKPCRRKRRKRKIILTFYFSLRCPIFRAPRCSQSTSEVTVQLSSGEASSPSGLGISRPAGVAGWFPSTVGLLETPPSQLIELLGR